MPSFTNVLYLPIYRKLVGLSRLQQKVNGVEKM